MSSVSIVFPHQLFENNPCISVGRKVIIVEEHLFFRQYRFHKQKLAFHRASMKFYESYLREKGFIAEYIDSQDDRADIRKLIPYLFSRGITDIHFIEPADNWLEKRLRSSALKYVIKLHEYPSPQFINSLGEIKSYFSDQRSFSQTQFYIHQRRSRNILLEQNGKPLGGKWSFDAENRRKITVGHQVPAVFFPPKNEYIGEALGYVKSHYPDNYGVLNPSFIYPVTFEGSREWLKQFLEKRFYHFGTYEDAIAENENLLHHSLLSPLLNTGLLTPDYVVETTLAFSYDNNIPLNSIEGFIRQITGWREFVRAVYELKGTEQRTTNYWGFKRKIPRSFWNGNTGVMPLDTIIKKLLNTAYLHHIERLMICGNFMLLCEFHPDEVYRWFMELFIDSYDWVMVPNVYGMSQYADGGIMATKPYISSSNYILKMSDFRKGEWTETWDGLFWRFMSVHRDRLVSNPRLRMLLNSFDNMATEKKKKLLDTAETFLNKIS